MTSFEPSCEPRGGGLRSPFWRGSLEAVLIVASFSLAGLVWAATEERFGAGGGPAPAGYADGPMAESDDPPIWLVDGYNVLHATLLGGRDRARFWTPTRRGELLERAGHFDDAAAEVWVVFDGPQAAPDADQRRPRCVFAPSADAWMVEQVRRAERPERLSVVTADRQVAARVAQRGATVVSPRDFLARCPQPGGGV